MFNDVVIGIDGSAGGLDAIALARELAAREAKLTLAHIYNRVAVPPRGSSFEFEREEFEQGKAMLEAARDETGVSAELCCAGAPSVGRGLHELAESRGADLLVVGSSHHSALGRVFLGDDTIAALNGAPTAVAIAPAGYALAPRTMREIGIAFNGSDESLHAVGVARKLAARTGAKLSAFEAVMLPMYGFYGVPVMTPGRIDHAVKEARDRIAALGDVEPHAVFGYAAEELALYGASLDLLVVGSRDYGPIGRLMNGSTARALARRGRCPLLILTRAARVRLGEGEAAAAATATA